MIARQAQNAQGLIDGYYIIYDGNVQVADVHGTIPQHDDDVGDQHLSNDEVRAYALLFASAPELKHRAEAAEARAKITKDSVDAAASLLLEAAQMITELRDERDKAKHEIAEFWR